ncbi:class I adenylate-forming enzyme family protein [Peristeroidobacter agariperforans]|uniref:class I adenylate-forming enzyme family protein n=1 Tax=Peristeroidobacter agariperforans TaxID=268404 RepID=UPI00101DB2AE|nr:long-chain-fatty-acid--CoA ligase [Peristeroidobacter agariperforans]
MFVEAIKRSVQIRPQAVATLCGQRSRTWAESMDRTARLAQALRELGVKANDRIGILALNSDRYLESIHATWWAGAVIVPMNTRWSVAEHLYSIDDADIQIVFADQAYMDTARALAKARDSIRYVIQMDDGVISERMLSHEALIAGNSPEASTQRHATDLAGIFYTGGTTGSPKGVMHSALSLWSGSMNLAFDARVPETPRYLHAAPMFHLGDLSQAFYTTALGGTHVFIPGFSAPAVIAAAREHRFQVTLLVPTMIGMLLDSPEFDSRAFDSLELMIYGGSPISEQLNERARQSLPNTRLVQGFGQTETNACGTILHEDARNAMPNPADRLRTAGRAAYGVQLAILDEEGKELPPHEVGEICIKSQCAMLGYWNKPAESAAALAGGWVHTGDAGYLDDQGFLFVCDRLKDMIISGGENVYSAEVERAIACHAAVAQVAVIGVPDDRWGERVHAVVVMKQGETISLADLQAHCKQHIAGYKIPRSVELRDAPLPLSSVGKVLKRELRLPHWHGKSRSVN